MKTSNDLIPRPPVVREMLARAIREARLLRRQLRVSVAAAEERHREAALQPPYEAVGRDGGQ
ncbi:MAG: hypothetical protein ACLP7Q_10280 [Isosphaeraceae bacterium]